MNSETIFTIKNEDLDLLDQDTAVEFLGKLLRSEALRLGPGTCKINVPRKPNVSDGGIDATVDANLAVAQSEIIASGKNGYQIKSGRTFAPWQEAVIKEELFGRGNPPDKENLGPGIQACIDTGGTYVLVCTGIELVDSQRRDALNHIKDCLRQCSDQDFEVDVWGQNTLIGFLQKFPSLTLWVNRRDELNFQTHRSWSRDTNMRVPYVSGESQNDLIAKIRSGLQEKVNTVHMRVLGEPGIGKTRLVLEATGTDDLAPLVIYCTAAQFRDSELMREILRDDNNFFAILVIDECDPDSRFYIWDKLQHRGPRIKLISIYNDYDPVAGSGISELETLRLEDDQIRTIIQGHDVSEEHADLYIEFCDGSPRMAHHTGNVLGCVYIL